MKAKLLKDGNVLEYNVARFYQETDRNMMSLQLAEPKIHTAPEKAVYRIELYDAEENKLYEFNGLFTNYHVMIDNSTINGQSGPLIFVNNSFGFVKV